MMRVFDIKWLDKDALEAIVYFKEGPNLYETYSCPCNLKVGYNLISPLVAFDPQEIERAQINEPSMKKTGINFSQIVVAKVKDVKNNLVEVGPLIIDIGNNLPGDIKEGECIQFEATRIDVIN